MKVYAAILAARGVAPARALEDAAGGAVIAIAVWMLLTR